MEYAALGLDRSRSTPPKALVGAVAMKARVAALLEKQAGARHCVRMHKLKKAIDETPPAILRAARLRLQMIDWLEQQDRLERRLPVR